jgi:hypothetical protein
VRLTNAQTLRRNCISSVSQMAEACATHLPLPRKLRGNGFPIHAEPTNNIKVEALGQARWQEFRIERLFFLPHASLLK